ncbi:MAG: PIG-L family deacetylase [Chloroflexi bacterium]|nr:PIG-L family deacetylase [Chloroflexota bacterium]
MKTQQRHIVVFGAHALDAEVMAGAVVAKHTAAGHRATLVHMTRGERGHPSKDPTEYAVQLEREMKEAAKALGADALWLGYRAGELPISPEVATSVAATIRKLRPDLVVTHWRGSWHPRHVSTHYNVLEGIKLAALPCPQEELPPHRVETLYFGENCEDLEGFTPTVYVDITDTFHRWFETLNRYELFSLKRVRGSEGETSEITIPYADYYRTMATIRGIEAKVSYAQAFMEARRLVDLAFARGGRGRVLISRLL